MRLFSSLFIVLSHLAGASFGENLPAQLTQKNESFEGAYAGLGVGMARANGTTDYPVLSGGTRYASYDPTSGKSFSGFAGYNFVRGNLVYGAEINLINFTGLSQIDATENREIMNLADIRARLGRRFGNRMIYGTLGWSWARFRVHPGNTFGNRPNQTTLQGLSLGLGVEYNLTARWMLRGELTYRELGGQFDEATNDTDIDMTAVSAHIGYRF